jgi:uncharacterized membrane protein
MSLRSNICAGLATLCLVLPILPSFVQPVIAIPMLFFVPGYLVMSAVSDPQGDTLERSVLSFGTSIAISILLGLSLNYFSILDATAWSVGVGLLTLVLLPFARLERPRAIEKSLQVGPVVIIALSTSIASASLAFARSSYERYAPFDYSSFWMVPAGSDALIVGVTNHEKKPTTYAIDVTIGANLLASWATVTLRDGETWQKRLHSPTDTNVSASRRIDAKLRKTDRANSAVQRVWAFAPSTPTHVNVPLHISAGGFVSEQEAGR